MVENKEKTGSVSSWINLEKKKIEFIQRDMEELGLDESCTISTPNMDELESSLGDEFPDYNLEITRENPDDIVVISGYSPIEEKDVKLYYYKSQIGESLVRQLREYNYKGELKGVKRAAIFEDGKYSELDEGRVSYAYDENGFKKYAKIDSELVGEKYFIYGDDGEVEFEITDEYVRQLIKDKDKEYAIIDGYFEPTDNDGFVCLSPKSIEDLKSPDIKRVVFGDISEEEKKLIIADLTEERKEQIVNAIRLIPELEWFTQEVELDYLDEVEDEEIVYTNPAPEEVVEESIRESVEKLRKSGRPYRFEQFIEDAKLEQHIGRAYGGDEFLAKLLEYAKRSSDLRERTGQAKDLLNEYEQNANRDGQTQSDEE